MLSFNIVLVRSVLASLVPFCLFGGVCVDVNIVLVRSVLASLVPCCLLT